jgi:hypothetical protein
MKIKEDRGVTLAIDCVLIDCNDLERMSEFWGSALNLEHVWTGPSGGYLLVDAKGTTRLGLMPCTDRYKIDPKVRAARRRNTPAKLLKNRAAGRGRKESAQKVAPAFDPPRKEASENVA